MPDLFLQLQKNFSLFFTDSLTGAMPLKPIAPIEAESPYHALAWTDLEQKAGPLYHSSLMPGFKTKINYTRYIAHQ